jgi:hypothetical protein
VREKDVCLLPPLFVATNTTFCIVVFASFHCNNSQFYGRVNTFFIIFCLRFSLSYVFFYYCIIHLSSLNFLTDFLSFPICCRLVAPNVVELSPHCRELKHHFLPVSLKLQVHLYFQSWRAVCMFSVVSFFSIQCSIVFQINLNFLMCSCFLYFIIKFSIQFLILLHIFFPFSFIFLILTMLLKFP